MTLLFKVTAFDFTNRLHVDVHGAAYVICNSIMLQ